MGPGIDHGGKKTAKRNHPEINWEAVLSGTSGWTV